MSVLVELFKAIQAAELDVAKPRLRPLKRSAAEELALAAVLLPIVVSDVKMPFHPWIYANASVRQSKKPFGSQVVSEAVMLTWRRGSTSC